MNNDTHTRSRLALRIRDLLLRELGETVDVSLMLGPPEYARAVLSLCRGSRNTELLVLGEAFEAALETDREVQRAHASPHGRAAGSFGPGAQ